MVKFKRFFQVFLVQDHLNLVQNRLYLVHGRLDLIVQIWLFKCKQFLKDYLAFKFGYILYLDLTIYLHLDLEII